VFYIPLKYLSFTIRIRHHYQWKVAKFRPMFDIQGFWGRGIFIVPHLLGHCASVFLVSCEGPSHSVASYDTQGPRSSMVLFTLYAHSIAFMKQCASKNWISIRKQCTCLYRLCAGNWLWYSKVTMKSKHDKNFWINDVFSLPELKVQLQVSFSDFPFSHILTLLQNHWVNFTTRGYSNLFKWWLRRTSFSKGINYRKEGKLS
jgi:hypothetical protein